MISTLGLPYKRVDFKKSNPLVYCQKKFPANQIHIEVPGKLLPSYLLSLVHLIVSLSPILYAYLPAYAVIQSFFLTVDGRPCQKQMRFHFTKVEKTGSSTLASIFYRFVLTHQTQNVMVMTYGGHLDVTKRRAQVPGESNCGNIQHHEWPCFVGAGIFIICPMHPQKTDWAPRLVVT